MLVAAAHDFESWRNEARNLLEQRVSPDCVQWGLEMQPSLFVGGADSQSAKPSKNTQDSAIRVPPQFVALAQEVALFEAPLMSAGMATAATKTAHAISARKWSLLYSVLWRIVMENRQVLGLSGDPQVSELARMRKAVNRDRHKMKAFVRFQRVSVDSAQEYFVSWFEPAHNIVESTAPFFMRRFAGMQWSILCPQACAHWNGVELSISPGISRATLPPELLGGDVLDDFWRVYYCSIFNPARLKEKAMTTEMPKKYWRYLPESRCIKTLTNNSGARTQTMLEAPGGDTEHRRKKSRGLRNAQDSLRLDP